MAPGNEASHLPSLWAAPSCSCLHPIGHHVPPLLPPKPLFHLGHLCILQALTGREMSLRRDAKAQTRGLDALCFGAGSPRRLELTDRFTISRAEDGEDLGHPKVRKRVVSTGPRQMCMFGINSTAPSLSGAAPPGILFLAWYHLKQQR